MSNEKRRWLVCGRGKPEREKESKESQWEERKWRVWLWRELALKQVAAGLFRVVLCCCGELLDSGWRGVCLKAWLSKGGRQGYFGLVSLVTIGLVHWLLCCYTPQTGNQRYELGTTMAALTSSASFGFSAILTERKRDRHGVRVCHCRGSLCAVFDV